MCSEEFEKIAILKRGGQKVVFVGIHNTYGESFMKQVLLNMKVQKHCTLLKKK